MAAPLLSTYRAGENRVTASTLAVFERIDLTIVQELLERATGSGDELATVSFTNQVVKDTSTPDALIRARFSWWFETKTERDAYARPGHGRTQLVEHLTLLHKDPEALLFLLTPDAEADPWLADLDGAPDQVRARVLWVGFAQLGAQLKAVVDDSGRLIGEQTRYLLNELWALYEADGLLSSDDTVIVAARVAWPEYHRTHAYVCQPNRQFRAELRWFGFYAGGAIQPRIAKIEGRYDSVTFNLRDADAHRAAGETRLADLITMMLADGTASEGDPHGVVLLSGPDDPATERLNAPIQNDTVTAAKRPWAWTLGQRYTRLDALKQATRTSQL